MSKFFYELLSCLISLLATLDHLQKSKVGGGGQLPVLDLVLPLLDIKHELPTNGNLDTNLEGCTYILHDFDHALRHVSYLLDLLIGVSSSYAGTYEVTPFFQGNIAWILDSFLLLYEVERAWVHSFAVQQSAVETCMLPIRAVHSLLLSMDRSLPRNLKCKGYAVLARLCTEFCDYPDALSETSVEITFCAIILDLAANCVHHEPVAQAVRLQLLPALQNYQESQPELDLQSPDIIVCAL